MPLIGLLAWLPLELLPLVLVGGGLLVILRLLKAAVLLRTVLFLALLPAALSIIGGVIDVLPTPLLLAVLVLGGLWMLRSIAALMLGSAAGAHLVGALATDIVRGCIRLMLFPFRILRWLARSTT